MECRLQETEEITISTLRSVGSAIATAIKATVKAIGRTVKYIGRAGLGAVRLAGRAAMASVRVAGRAAYVGVGLVANAANNVLGLLGRGGGAELPEPSHNQETFAPDEAWLEEMEVAHLQHELAEVDNIVDEEPNALAYQYLVSDDKTRRTMSLNGVDPAVRSWCHSLCASERELVKRAGAQNMLRHINGGKAIAGVRRVKAREAVIDFTQRDQASAFEMDDTFGPGSEMRLAM